MSDTSNNIESINSELEKLRERIKFLEELKQNKEEENKKQKELRKQVEHAVFLEQRAFPLKFMEEEIKILKENKDWQEYLSLWKCIYYAFLDIQDRLENLENKK
jgi:hypothetical protein